MMFKQGMVLPGHPGNTGRKPLLIGLKKQVEAQCRYIFRGTYGLSSLEELIDGYGDESRAAELWRLKKKFHFDRIVPWDELFSTCTVADDKVQVSGNLFIERTGFNTFRFSLGTQTLDVNLNLGNGARYQPAYTLKPRSIKREYFSIIHTGEGNGWDPDHPCMGSLITYKGSFFLIDAGPGIENSLLALGLSVNDIAGVFHTHCHDDHFAGLTSLLRADHRIHYYATRAVRMSVLKKLSALMSIDERILQNSFNVHDLEEGVWNNLNDLEVQPILSPHPVETTALSFRTKKNGEYKTYTHLADICSKRILSGHLSEDPSVSGLSRQLYDQVWKDYLEPADLKKIDIGGGMVHGSAEDFRNDVSGRILLSHTNNSLSQQESEIGV